MNNKIGIITHYYNSMNYGGNLQAYALCRFLREKGYCCEQISYSLLSESKNSYSARTLIKKALNPVKVYKVISSRLKNKLSYIKLASRRQAINEFNKNMIPHSQQVYSRQDICNCNDYDIYITGSDQVWNPFWYHPAFFLDFVPEGKKKISYAASLGVSELPENTDQLFKDHLVTFDAISVRESNAVDLLKPLTDIPVIHVLDPVLLLSSEQWDEVSTPRLIKEKYIFAFFLGEDTHQRKVVVEYAKKKKLRIVTLPYTLDSFRKCDLFFGNKKIYEASPADFISLIKHAEYVFTDSFHASVFSTIYHKEFFAFRRTEYLGMSDRLYSLTQLFHTEDHFCNSQEMINCSYLESLPRIDYSQTSPEFERIKTLSVEFLQKNLTSQ